MHRFYLTTALRGGGVVINDPKQVHHIRNVLRMRVGERFVVFDGSGKEYVAEVSSVKRNSIEGRVVAARQTDRANGKLVIACALPKLGRMDNIIDALTQIGVDVIIPVVTERTVVRLNGAGKEARLARWRKIAMAAAAQSQRPTVPEVESISLFDEVVQRSSRYGLRLIATVCDGTVPLRDAIKMARESVLVLIGPEGDFTSREVETALEAGFIPVSLGRNVLRVAVAAIAIAAYIQLSGAMGQR